MHPADAVLPVTVLTPVRIGRLGPAVLTNRMGAKEDHSAANWGYVMCRRASGAEHVFHWPRLSSLTVECVGTAAMLWTARHWDPLRCQDALHTYHWPADTISLQAPLFQVNTATPAASSATTVARYCLLPGNKAPLQQHAPTRRPLINPNKQRAGTAGPPTGRRPTRRLSACRSQFHLAAPIHLVSLRLVANVTEG